MTRIFILKDDKTDHNGVVMEGIEGSSFSGRPMAYIGAPVMCHTCNTQGVGWNSAHADGNGETGRSRRRPVSVPLSTPAEARGIANHGNAFRLKRLAVVMLGPRAVPLQPRPKLNPPIPCPPITRIVRCNWLVTTHTRRRHLLRRDPLVDESTEEESKRYSEADEHKQFAQLTS